ncbi:MAG: methylenetetrahydrofolate--tRNA-(uracil(54)-C(5))-methyltransferase (FADH(2)-oxidizing) TrmFO [Clostridia bacterium]|nr:methylenetetrahydrofolate--tRNA-(uracil(54)-C(5))-methyltransferase (FADH(2)-oxidizing) TrmFO [Clostridia bacterium]
MKEKTKTINIIGAGLAGVEAASVAASLGVKVNLYEKQKTFSNLICSNSLKAMRLETASGLLKEELRLLDSICMKNAEKTKVPSGGALAVDRHQFSKLITQEILSNKNIKVIFGEAKKINPNEITIISAGPLCDGELAEEICKLTGEQLSFYDAVSPIITSESVDMDRAYFKSRYDRGDKFDYLNCPMNREEYLNFYTELIQAERVIDRDFLKSDFYQGCMPIEIMASRGEDTLRYGPLKPVGLYNDEKKEKPYAVLQLRRENTEGSLYNLVGFQTNLKFGEQRRVFSMIPALEKAEFMRYGVMHRNTYINSPKLLNSDLSLKSNPNIYFAGQIIGSEGYNEAMMMGRIAGISAAFKALNIEKSIVFPKTTMTGALISYITDNENKDFQPMGANFGILIPLDEKIRSKKDRYLALSNRAIKDFKTACLSLNLP